MEIGQLEQKLLNGTNVDTDGRRRTDDGRQRHNIIRSQKFLRSYKKYCLGTQPSDLTSISTNDIDFYV